MAPVFEPPPPLLFVDEDVGEVKAEDWVVLMPADVVLAGVVDVVLETEVVLLETWELSGRSTIPLSLHDKMKRCQNYV